ncbi:MAG: ankyrin repeat domain-containing protein [Gammaproteobacteria bacterium]|nr:ankyrin repeat domain-containing protein [Gammaproteobacteria bacterium]
MARRVDPFVDNVWENTIHEGEPAHVYNLIAAGADINAKDKHGQTAIMLASRNGQTDVVQLLVDANAELNVTAKYNLSALMLAVINHHDDVVRILVEAGADLNLRGSGAPGFHNKTAAELANDSGQEKVAAYLEQSQVSGVKDN